MWRCCLAVRRPWGEPTEEVTALRRFAGTTPPTDRLFTGQRRYGPKSGIYYYGSRFYSTDVGRFLQPDTIVPGAGNPQALNRYSYILNSPVKYTDPTGHHPYGACDSRGHYWPDGPDDHGDNSICSDGGGTSGGGVGSDPAPGPAPAPPPDPSGTSDKHEATPAEVYDYLRWHGSSELEAACTAFGGSYCDKWSTYLWYSSGACGDMCSTAWQMDWSGGGSCSLNQQTYEDCDYQVNPGQEPGECAKEAWIFGAEATVFAGGLFALPAVAGTGAIGSLAVDIIHSAELTQLGLYSGPGVVSKCF